MVDTPIGDGSPNYTLVSGDVGATIFCRVTATNASGSAQAFSNVVGPVVAAGGDTLPANAGGANLPAITPTTTVEGTLYTTTNGTWTGSPSPTFTRQWKSDATNVGDGSTTYTTVAGDVTKTITCVVTATNTVGSVNATSNSVGPVTAAGGGLPIPSTNLLVWLHAGAGTFQDSARTTPATADAAPVGGWADQSGNSIHFEQTSAGSAARPTLQTNELNSLPVLRFDGSQFLERLVYTPPSAGEVFIVVKAVNDPRVGDTAGLWLFGTSGITTYYPYDDGTIYDGWGSTARPDTGNPSVALTTWHVYNVVSVAGEWTSFINGTQHFTTASNTVGFGAYVTIAADGGTRFAGDIAEVIIYSAKCSAPDKTAVKSYLATKYGLTIA